MTYDQASHRTRAVPGSVFQRLGLLAGLILILSGCASTGGGSGGDNTFIHEDADVQIADAVPKAEPRSRAGNPPSYVVFGKRYNVKASSRGHVEKGMASWYGPGFHGRRTSNGERYDMYAMTAAHKHLPLPSYVEVVNLQNGRKATVRVNDRGPFKDGRVIDLSYAAAKKLGVVKPGIAMVELRAIDPARGEPAEEPVLVAAAEPKDATPAVQPPLVTPASTEPKPATVTLAAADDRRGLYLQVGAFGDRTNAEQLRARLVDRLAEQVHVRTADGGKAPLYKVHVGPLRSSSEAKTVSKQLASLGVTDSRIIAD